MAVAMVMQYALFEVVAQVIELPRPAMRRKSAAEPERQYVRAVRIGKNGIRRVA